MAEDESGESGQEKTEEPSQERRDKFREEGHIVRSTETTSFVVMATAAALLTVYGGDFSYHFVHGTQQVLHTAFSYTPEAAVDASLLFLAPIVKTLTFFVMALFASVLVISLMQTGLLFSPKALAPKWEMINPITGVSRMLRKDNLFQITKSILKVAAIGLIVFFTLRSQIAQMALLPSVPFWELMRWSGSLFLNLSVKVGVFLFIIAGVDYLYQWRSLHQKMMMSRQELKQEMKENQVSEHVRSKVSQIQKERAKRTVQKAVPKADVIVTNPTHFAVALSYKRNVDRAPKVVAKGADLIAGVIRKIATENNVPIYEYPELARGLYRKVRVGHSIPGELYESVARVLSYVYKMHQRRGSAARRF